MCVGWTFWILNRIVYHFSYYSSRVSTICKRSTFSSSVPDNRRHFFFCTGENYVSWAEYDFFYAFKYGQIKCHSSRISLLIIRVSVTEFLKKSLTRMLNDTASGIRMLKTMRFVHLHAAIEITCRIAMFLCIFYMTIIDKNSKPMNSRYRRPFRLFWIAN